MRIPATATVAILVFVCACENRAGWGGAERCDTSLWSLRWDDEGLPPPGAPLEWRVPPLIERPDGSGAITNEEYPWDLRERQAYYLRAGDDGFHLRIRAFVGTGWSNARSELLDVYLNAERVPVIADGVEVPGRVEIPLTDGVGRTEIVIPYERFLPGMNHVHLLATVDVGARDDSARPRIISVGGWARTVARDDATATTEWSDTMGWTPGPFRPRYATTVTYTSLSGREEPLLYNRPAIEGTTLRATLSVQRDPAIAGCIPAIDDTVAIVALLDGEPLPLAGHDRIIATVPEGEARLFDLEIELPTTPGPHHLGIYELPGLGRPQRLAGRNQLPPWSIFTREIVDASWEEPATSDSAL